jgi:anthranilate phosphoribosyltransferase
VENGSVRSEWLDPLSLGLEPAPLEALAGGDLAANRLLLEQVLRGAGTSAQRDVVALNTALVLWAAGLFDSPEAALSPALEALASGAAWQRLERLRQALPTPSAG